jgi:hypothetical protein
MESRGCHLLRKVRGKSGQNGFYRAIFGRKTAKRPRNSLLFCLNLPLCSIFCMFRFCKVLILIILNYLQGGENINRGVGCFSGAEIRGQGAVKPRSADNSHCARGEGNDLHHQPPAVGQPPSACPRQKKGAGLGCWWSRRVGVRGLPHHQSR